MSVDKRNQIFQWVSEDGILPDEFKNEKGEYDKGKFFANLDKKDWRKTLYTVLSENPNYDVGTYEHFDEQMTDENKLRYSVGDKKFRTREEAQAYADQNKANYKARKKVEKTKVEQPMTDASAEVPASMVYNNKEKLFDSILSYEVKNKAERYGRYVAPEEIQEMNNEDVQAQGMSESQMIEKERNNDPYVQLERASRAAKQNRQNFYELMKKNGELSKEEANDPSLFYANLDNAKKRKALWERLKGRYKIGEYDNFNAMLTDPKRMRYSVGGNQFYSESDAKEYITRKNEVSKEVTALQKEAQSLQKKLEEVNDIINNNATHTIDDEKKRDGLLKKLNEIDNKIGSSYSKLGENTYFADTLPSNTDDFSNAAKDRKSKEEARIAELKARDAAEFGEEFVAEKEKNGGYKNTRQTDMLDIYSQIEDNLNDVKNSNEKYRPVYISPRPGVGSYQHRKPSDEVDYRAAKLRNRLLKKAQESLVDGKNEQKNWGITNPKFIKGLAKGLFDFNTWTFNLPQLADNLLLKEAVEADEKGIATEEQKKLLDAAALNLVAETYYQHNASRMTKAGTVTGQMAPFMLEMLNPIASAGDAIVKRVAEKAIEKFGKGLMSTFSKNFVKLGVGAAEGLGMAVTSGAAYSAGDAVQRMTGDIQYKDENGEIAYNGTEGKEGTLKAIAKGIGSTAIDRATEITGAALTGSATAILGKVLKPVANAGGKVLKPTAKFLKLDKASSYLFDKLTPTKVKEIVEGTSPTKLYSRFQEFLGKTHWDGVVEENLEEFEANLYNALIIGDMDFTTGERGIFNSDTIIDTILGVSIFGGAISAINTATYKSDYAIGKKRITDSLSEAESKCKEIYGSDWNSVKEKLDNNGIEYTKDELYSKFKTGHISKDELVSSIRYLSLRERLNSYIETSARKAREEGENAVAVNEQGKEQDEEQNVTEEEKEKKDIVAPTISKLGQSYVDAKNSLDAINNEAITKVVNDYLYGNVSRSEMMTIYQSLTKEEQDVIDKYINAAQSLAGVYSGIEKQVEKSREKKVAEILDGISGEEKVTSLPDKWHTAVIDGKERYLINYNPESSAIYYRNDDGQVVSVDKSKFDGEINKHNANEIEQSSKELREELFARYDFNVSYPHLDFDKDSNIYAGTDDNPGTVIDTPNGKLICVAVGADGTIYFKKAEINTKTGNFKGVGEDIPMTIDETFQSMEDYAASVAENKDASENASGTEQEGIEAEGDAAPAAEGTQPAVVEEGNNELPQGEEPIGEGGVVPMPMDEKGKPSYADAGAERSAAYIYNESGLEEGDADGLVEKKIDEAKKALAKVEKEKPKSMDIDEIKAERADINARKAALEQELVLWEGIKAARKAQVEAANASEEERLRVEEEARLKAEEEKERRIAEKKNKVKEFSDKYGYKLPSNFEEFDESKLDELIQKVEKWEDIISNANYEVGENIYVKGRKYKIVGRHVDTNEEGELVPFYTVEDNKKQMSVLSENYIEDNKQIFKVEEINLPKKLKNKQDLLNNSVNAFNQALSEVPLIQSGVKEEDKERMTFEKFVNKYEELYGILAKYDNEYLRVMYDYIKDKLNQGVLQETGRMGDDFADEKRGETQKNLEGFLSTLKPNVAANARKVLEGDRGKQIGKDVADGKGKNGKSSTLQVTHEEGNKQEPTRTYIVDEARKEELSRRLKEKLNNMNLGVDPELLVIGVELSAYYIERGVRKFADYCSEMIQEYGEKIRPYLKAMYNGLRDMPELSDIEGELTPYEDVKKFDVDNFVVKTKKEGERVLGTEDNQGNPLNNIDNSVPLQKENININNNEESNLQSSTSESERGGHQQQQNEKVGGSTRNETEGSIGRRVDRRNSAHSGSDMAGSVGLSGLHQEQQRLKEPKNTGNNHAERGVNYAPKSVDARIEANINAIELMQQLITEGKKATKKQMAVLRQYSGWGGLGKAFNDEKNNPIEKRLRELLGDDAYEQANMSRNSAYYTPASIIDTMWDIARALGFNGGRVLEGSAGIGNIIGLMPTDMSENSDIQAVEIDSTTGNILSLLYPDAKVDIQGFEETKVPNGSVDLAITNVPFVTGLRVLDTTGDKDLSSMFHDIHDFCIAKNIRKLKEGGIGIFITSSGTLDNSQKLRNWIVGEGGTDVIGAFRLNNETFGGTGVTSDIIVVRKRVNGQKSKNAIDVSTVTSERTASYTDRMQRDKERTASMDYNRYFIEHPENMAGKMMFGFENEDTYRPTSKALYPYKGKNQEEMLSMWLNSFEGMREESNGIDNRNVEIESQYEQLGADVKEGSLMLDNKGNLCIVQFGNAVPLQANSNKVKGHTKVECFKSYKSIKDALEEVLAYQLENDSNEGLEPLLKKLNKAYDDFVKVYGHLHKNTSISFLRNDVDFPSVLALEEYKEVGDKKGNKVDSFKKSDIFEKRVIEKEKEPEPTNVKDGIIASIYKFGRIDIPYISSKLGNSEEEVKNDIISSGLGFEDPATLQMVVSYEYLSGNVREKLRQAEELNEGGKYSSNVEALRKVIPMDIPAHLINFTLGSSWIEPKLYEEYVKERTGISVKLTNGGGTWIMDTPHFVNTEQNNSFGVRSVMFDKFILGTELIAAAMQNKTIVVSKTVSEGYGSNKTTKTVVDKEATAACSAKIDDIRADFKDWAQQKMQSDQEMAKRIEEVYNEQFNNYVPIEVSMDFVPEYFGGANRNIKMRPHQAKAIVRGTMQPLLLAHEVGTGKTFTLISTAMEMRRLGTARKPMIVVQNSTVGQFVESAKRLYPNAKILTIEDKDHTAEGRRSFYAKIKYNDWDMIVVPQSVFERIPDSEERQMRFIQDKIDEKITTIEKMKEEKQGVSNGRNTLIRQAEKEIEQLKDQLGEIGKSASEKRNKKDEKKEAITKQNAEVRAREMLDRETDDVENFDDMGIDALLVDEAHEYKHLGFSTAMKRGVKGVDPSYSKKSQGVYLKTQAVLEKNNGRNVVFATGTPISNTAAEIWTFMRYLMPADTMKEYGIYYFDDFVRNFGNISQMLEFTTSGKFKENSRLAGYINLPELIRIWSGVADTVLTEEAQAVKDNVPDMEGGQAQDIYLPQTIALRRVMKFVKSELDRFEEMDGKEKKENSHIPLVMFGIAKAAAVDARLVMEDAEDDTNSKTNESVRQTLRSLKDSQEYRGTVAIFADNYQNKKSGFNIYEDIKKKLIDNGVSENEIVIMRSGMSIKKKMDIFDRVNRGEVRVILGSTFTLGTGVNIQERLHTLIHLDAPNLPMYYTQRNGRILRQGNLLKDMGIPVRILRFGVQDSLDVTAYQRLKTKGAIADSIMRGKSLMSNSMENREMEEDEDVFGDTVARLSGSQYAMLKNQAEREVRKYESKKKQWEADQIYVHSAIPRINSQIKFTEQNAADNEKHLRMVEEEFGNGKKYLIDVDGKKFSSIDEMADFFTEQNKKMKEIEDEVRKSPSDDKTVQSVIKLKIGKFTFVIQVFQSKGYYMNDGQLIPKVSRNILYSCPELSLGQTKGGQYIRNTVEDILDNIISGKQFREIADRYSTLIDRLKSELEQVVSRNGKQFQYSKELEDAKKRYTEYTDLMKQEMAEKEAKYAEMDSEVEEATDVVLSEEDSEEDIDNNNDDKHYRGINEFDDGQVLKVKEDELGGEYSVEGLGGRYSSRDRLLEQFRRKYGDYIARLNDDGDIVIERIDKEPQQPKSKKQTVQDIVFASREVKRMVDAVEKMADKLGVKVNVVKAKDGLEGNDRKAKGWYDPNTGEITIVVPNNRNVDDVMRTLLHEAVAHHGLRELFGANFDTFLDNVFNNVPTEIRNEIMRNAIEKYSMNIRKATEEYLASIAEDMDFERAGMQSWWGKVKMFFLEMLEKAGLKIRGGLSDADIRSILWRSYDNLKNRGEGRVKYAPGFRTYGSEGLAYTYDNELILPKASVADEETRLYRDVDASNDPTSATAIYDKMIDRKMYVFTAAFANGLDALDSIQKALEKATGKPIRGFENVVYRANSLPSVDSVDMEKFKKNYLENLVEAAKMLFGKKKILGLIPVSKINDAEREELKRYMFSKHGLERNEVFAMRDAMKEARENEDYDNKVEELKVMLKDGSLTQEEYDNQIESLDKKVAAEAEKLVDKYRKTDYSGLTALFDIDAEEEDAVAKAEAMAKMYVDNFEGEREGVSIGNFWNWMNETTHSILNKQYECGMITEEQYNRARTMFNYYVPLRGFTEDTAEDVYNYINSSSNTSYQAPIKKANKRSSEADDPFDYIVSMAMSGILSGNRNLRVKQAFYNLALYHKTPLLSTGKVYARINELTGEYETMSPDIPLNATAEQASKIVDEFEKKMEKFVNEKPEEYVCVTDNLKIPYRLLSKTDKEQHQVVVKRGGKPYVVYVNGNPAAAQAINGAFGKSLNIPFIKDIITFMSKAMTTRNPKFIPRNFIRDALSSRGIAFIKEGASYKRSYIKNWWLCAGVLMKVMPKYHYNSIDEQKKYQVYYKEFVDNGGETGYAYLKDMESLKKEINKMFGKMSFGDYALLPFTKAVDLMDKTWSPFNAWAETVSRFAAFVTSRERGRDLDQSIRDAKEISVNFNTKGAGIGILGSNSTRTEKSIAYASEFLKTLFIFFNPGVQGIRLFGNAIKEHPLRGGIWLAKITAIGFAMPFVNSILQSLYDGGDGDDDKEKDGEEKYSKYDKLPDYIRRNNINIYSSCDVFASIPLSQEMRVPFGIGELLYSQLVNKEYTDKEFGYKLLCQITQMFPVDINEGGGGYGGLVPTYRKPLKEVSENKSWNGYPIWKGYYGNYDTDDKNPMWTRDYEYNRDFLTEAAKFTNEISGGNDYKKGDLDWNPAKVRYIMNGYLGGLTKYPISIGKLISMINDEDARTMRNMPLLSGLTATVDNKEEKKAINKEYHEVVGNAERYLKTIKDYFEASNDSTRSEKEREMYKSLYDIEMQDTLELRKNKIVHDMEYDISNMKRQGAELAELAYKEFINRVYDATSQEELDKVIEQKPQTIDQIIGNDEGKK